MGSGLERSYSKLFFIKLDYDLIVSATWFLYRTNPRVYKMVQKLTQNMGKPLGVVITYIVVGLPYSIFQIQYIFQPDLLHMRC